MSEVYFFTVCLAILIQKIFSVHVFGQNQFKISLPYLCYKIDEIQSIVTKSSLILDNHTENFSLSTTYLISPFIVQIWKTPRLILLIATPKYRINSSILKGSAYSRKYSFYVMFLYISVVNKLTSSWQMKYVLFIMYQ